MGETTATSYMGKALYGAATQVRVAAVGIARGPWTIVYYGSSAGYMWSADATVPMWASNSNNLMWKA